MSYHTEYSTSTKQRAYTKITYIDNDDNSNDNTNNNNNNKPQPLENCGRK